MTPDPYNTAQIPAASAAAGAVPEPRTPAQHAAHDGRPHNRATDQTGTRVDHPEIGGPGGSTTADQFTANPLRRTVADRLTLIGRRHHRHRTEHDHTPHRPGPHAIAFLHYEPHPAAAPGDLTHGQIKIAPRMFLDGDDVADLHTILTTLHQRALEYWQAGVRQPVVHLADDAEPMNRASRYIGIATSSTDTRPSTNPADWTWQGLAHLHDGTRLVLRATTTVTPVYVQSTHTLDTPHTPINLANVLNPHRAWYWAPPDTDETLTAQQDALADLHDLIAATESERRTRRRTTVTSTLGRR